MFIGRSHQSSSYEAENSFVSSPLWPWKWTRRENPSHIFSVRSVPHNLNCFWTNGTSLTHSLTLSLIHLFSHKSLIPSQICPLLRIRCIRISTAKSKLDSLDDADTEKEKEESSEKEREADNFWHESHKTLRGEQIINSNSTKKMAAAAVFAIDDGGGGGDAVATNSPLLVRLSHSENMYVHIPHNAHRGKEKEISLCPVPPPSLLVAPWKM